MAMEARIDVFSTKVDADNFFDSQIKGNKQVDGLIIKRSGHYSIYKADTYVADLVDGEEVFLVVSYPKGTGVTLDTSSSG